MGVDTLSEFFVRLRLHPHLGCSPTALRGVLRALEKTIGETAHAWAQEGTTPGTIRDIIEAMDATFLEHMMLVCMDLPRGYWLVEAVAADRPSAPWKAVVDERLKGLGAAVLSLVRDRAQALVHLADMGFECLRMPDFCHCVPDIVKPYALTLGRRLRDAPQALAHAAARLTRHHDPAPGGQDPRQDALLVEARRAAGPQWTDVQQTSRRHLETLSLTLPPFNLDNATVQTSAQVTRRLHAEVEAIAAIPAEPPSPVSTGSEALALRKHRCDHTP